jgi:probable rRNA maturation factor
MLCKAKFVELHFLTIFEIMAVKVQPKIYFFYDGIRAPLKNRTALKSFIISIFRKEKINLNSASFIFSTDKIVLRINKEYLNHNYLTDIIAFPLSEPNHPMLADIYISVDRVFENSRTLNISQTEELHRVIFHGILHLCGYSDKTQSQKAKMRAKESFYLSKYFNRRVT